MKTLVYQYFDRELPVWAKISKERFEAYARMHGADYEFKNALNYTGNPYFEHLELVYDQRFLDYDRILYVDMDVIPENLETNIFERPVNDVGLIAEKLYDGMSEIPFFVTKFAQSNYKKCLRKFGLPEYKTSSGSEVIFNSGVILWTRNGLIKARKHFMDWKVWFDGIRDHNLKLDQPFINSQLTKFDVTELPLIWNCYPRTRWEPGRFPEEAIFVHYTGMKKLAIEEIYK